MPNNTIAIDAQLCSDLMAWGIRSISLEGNIAEGKVEWRVKREKEERRKRRKGGKEKKEEKEIKTKLYHFLK